MQIGSSQIGIICAIARFSYFVVPVGNVPSTGSALTGSRSPSPAISRAVTSRTKSGAVSGTSDAIGRRRADGPQGDPAQPLDRQVDRGEVALDDGVAALRVGLLHEVLDPRRSPRRPAARPTRWKKQGCMTVLMRLPMPISAATAIASITHRSICFSTSWCWISTGRCSQTSSGPYGRVEQERRAVLGVLEDLDGLQQAELVAGHEVRVVARGTSSGCGSGPKRRCDEVTRAGLLGVVDEVALGEQVRALADDLHRRLVRADGAVRAEAVEQGLDLARRPRVAERRVDREAEVGDVVVDADREVALRLRGEQLVEDRLDHRRRELLGGQAVAAADDARGRRERRVVAVHRLGERRDHRLVQRLADGARLLGPVQDGDRADRLRQRGHDLLAGERLEQADGEHPDLLAGGDHGVHGLLDRARCRNP